jgi:hypothetical protein
LPKLNEALGVYAKSLGVDLFGVADLSSAKVFIENQGGSTLGGLPEGSLPRD